MGKYTQYKEEFVDKAIDNHLKIAVEELSKIKDIISIIIFGGFGRSEGGVKIQGKKVTPVNDYDLYVITKKHISEELLNNIAKKIEKRLGVGGYSLYEHSKKEFYFDIKPILINELKNLPSIIKYYELKNASYVIYGKDYRNLMPDFKKENLPLSDTIRFLFNRISAITEWFLPKYLKNEKIEDWEREVLIDDTSKTYLECCTTLCLLANIYEPSYLKRLQNFKKIYKKKFKELDKKYPDLLDRIEFHTYLKLKPDFNKIKDVNRMWFRAREHALGVATYLLQKYNIKDFDDFDKISTDYVKPYVRDTIKNKFNIKNNTLIYLFSLLAQIYLTFLWFFRIYKFKNKLYFRILTNFRDPGIRIFSAVPFIIQSVDKNGNINKIFFDIGIKKLKMIYPFEIKKEYTLDNYDLLRKNYTDAWKLYFFQKII